LRDGVDFAISHITRVSNDRIERGSASPYFQRLGFHLDDAQYKRMREGAYSKTKKRVLDGYAGTRVAIRADPGQVERHHSEASFDPLPQSSEDENGCFNSLRAYAYD